MIQTTKKTNTMHRVLSKISLLLLLASVTVMASAQSAELSREITLSGKTQTRRQAMETIKAQTDYGVIFNARTLDEQAEIQFGRTSLPLSATLDKLTEGTGQTYTLDNKLIIIHLDNESKIAATDKRNVSGTVNGADGKPLEGVTLEFLDARGRKTKTNAQGHFSLGSVNAGNHVVKLTSADGQLIRYREIIVPTGQDATVTLSMDGIRPETETQQSNNVIGTIKSTAYYVPTVIKTGPSFTGEPKNMFVVSADDLDPNYLPKVAVKTNLLYAATTSLNLGVEFALAHKWTLDITAGLNPWNLQKDKGGIRHWLVQPEVRYWFCNRFERHFIGLHGIYGEYQIQNIDLHPFGKDLRGIRYDGWGVGGGISYGYHLPMGLRWAWEFTVGAGYIYLNYDKYNCGECDKLLKSNDKHYFGPTKAGISLIFMIK